MSRSISLFFSLLLACCSLHAQRTDIDSLYQRGQVRKALTLLTAIPADSLSRDDMHTIFKCYTELGQRQKALATAKDIVAIWPDDGEMVANIASYYNSFKEAAQADTALMYTSPYMQRDSSNVYVFRQHVRALYLTEKYGAAINGCLKLRAMGDSTYSTAYTLGRSYYLSDNAKKAYEPLMEAARLKEFKDPNSLTQLGFVCVETGRSREGADYLQMAEQALLPPQKLMSSIYHNMEEGYMACGQNNLVIETLERHLSYIPTAYYLYYKLSQVYMLMGDGAKEEFYLNEFLTRSTADSEELTQMRTAAQKRLLLLTKLKEVVGK